MPSAEAATKPVRPVGQRGGQRCLQKSEKHREKQDHESTQAEFFRIDWLTDKNRNFDQSLRPKGDPSCQ